MNTGKQKNAKAAGSTTKFKPGSNEAMREFIRIAREIRSSAKPVLDPSKSVKELYKESMNKKYGVS